MYKHTEHSTINNKRTLVSTAHTSIYTYLGIYIYIYVHYIYGNVFMHMHIPIHEVIDVASCAIYKTPLLTTRCSFCSASTAVAIVTKWNAASNERSSDNFRSGNATHQLVHSS